MATGPRNVFFSAFDAVAGKSVRMLSVVLQRQIIVLDKENGVCLIGGRTREVTKSSVVDIADVPQQGEQDKKIFGEKRYIIKFVAPQRIAWRRSLSFFFQQQKTKYPATLTCDDILQRTQQK